MSFKHHSHELDLPLHPELFVRLIHQAHSGHRALVFHSFSHFWLLPCFYCNIAMIQGEERCFILDSSLAKSTHILHSFPESALFFFPKLHAYLSLCSFLDWLMVDFPNPPLQHHALHSTLHPHPLLSSMTLQYSLLPFTLPFAWRTRVTLLSVPYPFREHPFFPGVFGGWFSWPELTRVCAVSFWGVEEEAITPSLEGISVQIVISDKPQRVWWEPWWSAWSSAWLLDTYG